VFNADQVDGYGGPSVSAEIDTVEGAEGFVTRTGAKIVVGGHRACYVPATDEIRMPLAECLIS